MQAAPSSDVATENAQRYNVTVRFTSLAEKEPLSFKNLSEAAARQLIAEWSIESGVLEVISEEVAAADKGLAE